MMIGEIEIREKKVCKRTVRYEFARTERDKYEISISQGEDSASAEFYGDFFDVIALFKAIVETDTLPINLADISEDVKNFALV